MSNVIDERVVSMRFDNSNFEKNVESSIKSLNNLNDSINSMSNANIKGLDNISKSISSFNMNPISDSLDAITGKFSAWSIAGMAAIKKVSDQAVDAGQKILKAFTVDNLSAGWDKFGEKTKSVGTLVSQGFDLEEVEEQVGRLNWFTDETSYNLTDMIDNIGKFTASGLGLKDSADAMQGIALWAAVSGQNATTASRAMYQLSQALGKGYVQKTDWMSIQTANMDTQEFRQTAIEAAVALGTLKKAGDDAYEALQGDKKTYSANELFGDGLAKGQWLSTDVMMKSFQKYSSAVDKIYEYAEEHGVTASEAMELMNGSLDEFGLKAFKAGQEARTWEDVVDSVKDAVSTGWMSTYEMIFGNYTESTKLFTAMANELYDVFAEAGNERNIVLGEWKELGGRDTLAEGLAASWSAFRSVLSDVSEAFRSVFPKKTAQELMDITTKFSEYLLKFQEFVETSNTAKTIYAVFKSIFASINQLKIGAKNLVDALKPLIVTFQTAFGEVFNTNASTIFMKFSEIILKIGIAFNKVTSDIKDFISNSKNLEKFKDVFKGVASLLDIIKKVGISVYNIIIGIFKPILASSGTVASLLLNVAASISKIFTAINSGIPVITSFDDLKNRIINSFVAIKTAIKEVFDSKSLGKSINLSKIIEAFNIAGFSKEAALQFTEFINTVQEKISNLKNSIKNLKISELFSSIKDSKIFDSLHENFQENASRISKVIDWLKKRIASIGNVIDWVKTKVSSWDIHFPNLDPLINSIKKLGSGIFNVIISGLNLISSAFDGLAKSFESSPLLTLQTVLKSIASSGIFLGIKNLIDVVSTKIEKNGVADALTALITSIKKGNVLECLKQLKSTLAETQKDINSKIIRNIAISVGILAASLVALSMVDTPKLGWALGALSVMLGELTAAIIALKKTTGSGGLKGLFGASEFSSTSTALIKFAIAVGILGSSLAKLTNTGASPIEMLTAVAGLSALLWELVAVADILGSKNTKGFSSAATSILIFAVAVDILAKPLGILAQYSWDQMLIGVIGLSAIIWELVGVSKKIKSVDLGDTSGFLMLAVSVKMLGSALAQIGQLSWDQLLLGVIGMTTCLGELLIAAKIMEESGITLNAAAGFVAMALGVKVLGDAIATFANTPYEQLVQGFLALLIAMGALLTFAKLLPKQSLASAALILMAAAVGILANSIQKLGVMKIEDLLTGLLGIAGGMAVLVAACYLVQNAIGGAIAMLIISVAMIALAKAIQMLASLNIDQVCTALVALGGALLILIAAMFAMQYAIGGAVALVIVSVGLIALAAAMKMLGSMSINEVGNALIALAGAIGVLALASVLLSPIIIPMLMLGAALALAGAGVAALGAGIYLLAEGMGILGSNGVAGAEVLVQICMILAQNIKVILEATAAFLAIDAAIYAFGVATLIAGVAVAVLGAGLLILAVGALAFAGAVVLTKDVFIELLAYMPLILANLQELALIVIEGVAAFIAFDAGLLIFAAAAVAAAAAAVILAVGSVTLGAALLVLAVGILAVGVATKVFAEALEIIFKTVPEAIEHLSALINKFKDAGKNIIEGLINGIKDKAKKAVEKIKEIGTSILDTFRKVLGIHSPSKESESDGKNYGLGFINGIDSIKEKVGDSTFDLGSFANTSFTDGLGNLVDGDIELSPSFELDTDTSDLLEQLQTSDISNIQMESFDTSDLIENQDELTKSIQNTTEARKEDAKVAEQSTDTIINSTNQAVISADELEQKAKDVIAGKYGNGADRVKALGDEYAVIQNKVNEMLGSSVRHETNYTVVTDTSQITEAKNKTDELNNSVNELTNSTKSYQAQVLENADKLPTAVKEAVKEQMSWQEKLLQNESKLPTEVANKLKEVNAQKAKAANDFYSNFGYSTKHEITEMSKLSNLNIDSSTSTKVSVDTTEVKSATTDVNNLSKSIQTANDTTIETEVTPTFKLTDVNTKEIKSELTKALTEAGKDILVKPSIKIELDSMKKQFVNFFSIITKSVNDRSEEFSSDLSDAFSVILFDTLSDLEEFARENFTDIGTEFAEAIPTGVNRTFESGNILSDAFSVILFDTLSDLEEFARENFTDIGTEFAEGLAKGISRGYKAVKEASIKLAKLAVSAMEEELDINSPSRVAADIGMYVDLGFAKGLDEYSNKVKKSASKVGTGVEGALNDTLSSINFDDIDTTPTIRPVLDLSDVESKSALLNSMFGTDNVSSISTSFANSSKNDESSMQMNNQMNQMNQQMARLIDIMNNQDPTPIDVSVELQGDAKNLFNMVKKQGNLYTRTTGKYAF